MDHSVLITEQAYDQVDKITDHIAQNAPEAARRWRHGLAPEAQAVGVALHQMMCGNYRILYTVNEELVMVHGVRPGARRPLRPDELPGSS